MRLSQQKGHHILLSIKSSEPIINIQSTKYPVLRQVANKMNITISDSYHNILWTDSPPSIKEIKAQEEYVKTNHFPEIRELTRKNKMAAHLNTLRIHFPKDYSFYPETYLLPMDYQRLIKKHTKDKVYIVKPESGCQGQGIFLNNNPLKLEPDRAHVVQQYIVNPMLIEQLKFDLRIYALITCVQPLRVFLYDQGMVRLATEPFAKPEQSNLNNLFCHLTNYAINKQHQSFQIDFQNGQGHKRLYSSVFKNQEQKEITAKISKIINKTIIAVLPTLQNAHKQCKKNDPNAFFQLLGFDILLTDKKQPILLEVNQNPSLATETPLDHELKFGLVKNIIEMVTGGYRCSPQDKLETRIKLKDKHEWATRGNFTRIYPCASLQQTQLYDLFIQKSTGIYRQRFGIGLSRQPKKMSAQQSQFSVCWNDQPLRYNQNKMEKIYTNCNTLPNGVSRNRTSVYKKRIIFL